MAMIEQQVPVTPSAVTRVRVPATNIFTPNDFRAASAARPSLADYAAQHHTLTNFPPTRGHFLLFRTLQFNGRAITLVADEHPDSVRVLSLPPENASLPLAQHHRRVLDHVLATLSPQYAAEITAYSYFRSDAEQLPATSPRGHSIVWTENLPSQLQASLLAMSDRLSRLQDSARARQQQRWTAVGTDASIAKRYRGAGIACVTESGNYSVEYLPACGNIYVAELAAIALALQHHPGNLQIFCDNRKAVKRVQLFLRGGSLPATRREEHTQLVQIQKLSRGRQIQIEWVRGHHGHPLNETADRLAVQTRRSEGGQVIPQAAFKGIIAGILEDFKYSYKTGRAEL